MQTRLQEERNLSMHQIIRYERKEAKPRREVLVFRHSGQSWPYPYHERNAVEQYIAWRRRHLMLCLRERNNIALRGYLTRDQNPN